jgi:hypothetical protein
MYSHRLVELVQSRGGRIRAPDKLAAMRGPCWYCVAGLSKVEPYVILHLEGGRYFVFLVPRPVPSQFAKREHSDKSCWAVVQLVQLDIGTVSVSA